jgi:hypothetical protein
MKNKELLGTEKKSKKLLHVVVLTKQRCQIKEENRS